MSDNYMLGKNPYQGAFPKVLFVCTGGILRSATGAHWGAINMGWNTRSCGIMAQAIPTLDKKLLEWADRVYCMESHHYHAISEFGPEYAVKTVVLNIPDNFAYRDPELVKLFEERLKSI